MSDTFERVQRIAVDFLGVDAGRITPTATWSDDLGADSLDRIELVMAAEEEFGIAISDDAAQAILTVSDAVRLIDREMKAAA